MLSGDGKLVPINKANTINVKMVAQDDLLMMEYAKDSGTDVIVFEKVDAGSSEDRFEFSPELFRLSAGDFEVLLNCPTADLTVLKGGGRTQAGGSSIEFSYELLAYGYNPEAGASFVGTLAWTGDGMAMKRLVFLNQ